MRKLLPLIAVLLASIGRAQDIPEPEFIGEVTIVNLDTKEFKRLPKERGIIRVSNFMGEQTKKIVLSEESPFLISDRTSCAFIIKAADNRHDPMSVIQVFRFEKNLANQRVTELNRISIGNYYSQGEGNRKIYVDFEGKKYGESSYLITFPITAGQYGIIAGAIDESNLIIATFDAFDSAQRSTEDYYRKLALAKAQLAEREKLAKQQKKAAKKTAKRQSK